MVKESKVYFVGIPADELEFCGFVWACGYLDRICFAVKANGPVVLELWVSDAEDDTDGVRKFWVQGEKSVSLLVEDMDTLGAFVYPKVKPCGNDCQLIISPTYNDSVVEDVLDEL